MRVVFLTRTSRPSGAIVLEKLLSEGEQVVAVVAERRSSLLGKKKRGSIAILVDSFSRYGFRFTMHKVRETALIKLHFLLRKLCGPYYKSDRFFSVEELVLARKVPLYIVDNHNQQDALDLVASLKPDLLVITNTRLLGKSLLHLPSWGALNLHLSKLPQYTGLNSIFWALYFGEKEIGVTVHKVIEELDAGDIILQKTLPIESYDNEESLYEKAIELGAQMMVESIRLINSGQARPLPQDVSPTQRSRFSWPTKEQRRQLQRRLRRRGNGSAWPLKVLHIITRLVKGGAQENTLQTVLGLRQRGYEVVLATGPSLGPEGELESKARSLGIELVRIPHLVRPVAFWYDLLALKEIFLLIKREKFAIVHTHTSKAGILGRLAARMAGVPLVVHTPHGHIFSSYFSSIETRVFIWLERIWAIFTDRIITLTEGCKRDHVRLHIARPEKFVTIPSGVDPQRFSNHDPALPQHIRERLKLPLKGRIIGTVARLDPIKGIPYLLEAVKRLIPRHPDIHCVIVGDGVLRRELECFVQRLGLQPRVTFLGLQDDVPQLLSLMDVFVLPSLNEGMGRVLVEAGLMAKPIVATNVSGIPDLVTHDYTGILVAPKDSQALAEGIREMLEDSVKAQRLGQQARMRMLAGFTVQDMVAKIDALYKEVAREKM